MFVGDTGLTVSSNAPAINERERDVRELAGIRSTSFKSNHFWFSYSLDLFGGEISSTPQTFSRGLKVLQRAKSVHGSHRADGSFTMQLWKPESWCREVPCETL